MEEKTTQLLEQLAAKLGTTTEYLWGILINQAKYDALVSIIQMSFMAIIIYTTIKLHIKFSKKDKDGKNEYYYKEDLLTIPMIFASIISLLSIVFFLTEFNSLIISICNPEYWALNKVLSIFNK
jgi:hypothetical protein